jgi:molybdopterin synthase sulfur carrier subunit
MPLVKLYANLRSRTGKKEVQLPGSTMREVLDELVQVFPVLKTFLFIHGAIAPRVIISLNGQTLGHQNLGGTSVNEEDIIAIFPPVAGG